MHALMASEQFDQNPPNVLRRALQRSCSAMASLFESRPGKGLGDEVGVGIEGEGVKVVEGVDV